MKTEAEITALRESMDNLLDKALTSEPDMRSCMEHYRITGLYHYSLMNSLLIALQGGRLCNSYKRWQEMGRQVRAGERAAILIWRPAIRKAKVQTDDGEEMETETFRGAFFVSKVFDISQTDGKPIEFNHNTPTPEGFSAERFAQAAQAMGFPVSYEVTTSARGYTDGKKIVVSSLSNEADKARTIFHELGHCLLGHAGEHSDIIRDAREVEAECVAHLCCSFFGVPNALSPAYITAYRAGKDSIRKGKILRTAQQIIKAVNQ